MRDWESMLGMCGVEGEALLGRADRGVPRTLGMGVKNIKFGFNLFFL